MQISENLNLAESIASLLHIEHIENIQTYQDWEIDSEGYLVEQSLLSFVETSDAVYYAYILKKYLDEIKIVVDSAKAKTEKSSPIKYFCEQAKENNLKAFKNGKSIFAESIKTDCGRWIRVLTPLYNTDKSEIIAVLGLNYSAKEWNIALFKKNHANILILVFINILVYVIFLVYKKNMNLKESEREKSVILSHLPGMAYCCKNDEFWTMELVSEGSVDLTGYRPEELIDNKLISYSEVIVPDYAKMVKKEWDRVLLQRKTYSDEYEILTKNGEKKWVMEKGQGIFDEKGNVIALEGLVLDITDKKLQEYQIENLKDHDLLTGLFNRSYIEKKLQQLSKENIFPLSLVLCDIDGLVVVNDSYGHEEGDRLIRFLVKLIKQVLPENSIFAYLGGGDFLIALPHIDKEGAEELKSKIINKIDLYNKNMAGKSYLISLSIGHSTKVDASESLKDKMKELENNLKRRKLINQNSSHSAILSSIMATLYEKSQETEEHGQRLGEYCLMLAKELNLSQVQIDELLLLSKLHDIGKIGIEDRILNKAGKLTEDEWRIMKKHPEIGSRIATNTPQFRHIADSILSHHERWDGKGYPNGLAGEEIPLVARILALADAYDAMTEDRIYRKALSKEEAIEEIRKNAGTQFDPKLAELFIRLLSE